MELDKLQQLFAKAMNSPNSDVISLLSQEIEVASELSRDEGLAIYRGSIKGSLSKTLQSIYPVCFRLVGEQFFAATASAYIACFPSYSEDLGNYGEEFADFLRNFPPANSLPYLPDVACLEWYWHRIFHGENSKKLDYQVLSQVPPESWGKLCFHLPKNSILLESSYPIYRIWQANQSDYQGEYKINLDEGGNKIFLWRKGYEMRLDLPSSAEWQLLKALGTGNCLEVICQDLARAKSPVDVGSLLPEFVQRGWISSFAQGI